MACKPDFVQGGSPWMTIHLGRLLPDASCCQPGLRGQGTHLQPLFGIAPGGACRATPVARGAVRSCRTVSPLLRHAKRSVLCGAFPRVAPAGRYPAPLPCGVRTFLGRCHPRPSGHPRQARYRRRQRQWQWPGRGFHTPGPPWDIFQQKNGAERGRPPGGRAAWRSGRVAGGKVGNGGHVGGRQRAGGPGTKAQAEGREDGGKAMVGRVAKARRVIEEGGVVWSRI